MKDRERKKRQDTKTCCRMAPKLIIQSNHETRFSFSWSQMRIFLLFNLIKIIAIGQLKHIILSYKYFQLTPLYFGVHVWRDYRCVGSPSIYFSTISHGDHFVCRSANVSNSALRCSGKYFMWKRNFWVEFRAVSGHKVEVNWTIEQLKRHRSRKVDKIRSKLAADWEISRA